MNPSAFRHVFVAGMSRSGTTLLCTVLDSHPDISMGYELLPSGLPPLDQVIATLRSVDPTSAVKQLRADGYPDIAKFVRQCERARVDVESLVGILEARRSRGAMSTDAQRDRALIAHAIISRKVELEGTLVGGLKNNSPDSQPFLDWFPDAHFIFIVRDPRDVVASHLDRNFPKTVHEVCRAWRNYVANFLRFRSANPDVGMFVRYEDLVKHPKPTTRTIAEFIGVEHDERMLRFFDSKASIHGLGHIENDRIAQDFYTSSAGRWRTDLPTDTAQYVASELADLMPEFEYPTAINTRENYL